MSSEGSQSEISLPTGRLIHLRELHQTGTYEGLLEGVPTPEMNAHHKRVVLENQRQRAIGGAVHLIEPIETQLEEYLRRARARIPIITCVGRFVSWTPARDQKMCASSLVIIWFQEQFAMPIEVSVLRRIQQMDWDTLAADFDI